MPWFKAIVLKAHLGRGKKCDIPVYIYAKDPILARKKIKIIRGIKRSQFLEIIPLNQEKADKLERIISEENVISVNKAKRTWYFIKGNNVI